MASSEAERLVEACLRLNERVHAEAPLSAEEKSGLSFLLGITAGQAVRIEQLQARVAELERAYCPKHGAFQATQEGACPACWRGE